MKFAAAPVVLAMLCSSGAGVAAEKPKLTLKANPTMAFSPARIVVTGELTGVADDNQGFYCPAVEWEWGDGTKSEESADCEPYEAGKTEIKHRFTTDHVYRIEEPQTLPPLQQVDYRDFHILLRLRKNGKVIVTGATTVKIKPESDPA